MNQTSGAAEARLRVLFVGMRYDYGDPGRGDCYEYRNLFHTLTHMEGVLATHFPFDVVLRKEGRRAMNALLLKRVKEDTPDICVFALFSDEFERSTLDTISGITNTVNWFADDHWRFDSFSRYWAPCFRFVATTDSAAVERYHAAGIRNVIRTQWAYDHFQAGLGDVTADLGVTFIGQVHSGRRALVQRLIDAGIDVRTWGKGWPGGRLASDELTTMFVRSRINLNFVEGSIVRNPRSVVKVLVNRRADDSLRLRSPGPAFALARTLLHPPRPQIKGRTFEVPGAGGFLLTGDADDLASYLVPGKEIGVFSDAGDLVEKVRYYLSHDDEREAIRRAGHKRVLREHTYEERLLKIFEEMGVHANL